MGVPRAGRWFHTIVVVGSSLTACGGRVGSDAADPDGGSGDSSAGQPTSGPAVATGADAASADARSDAPAVYADAASSVAEAAVAPDASNMTAMCCDPATLRCRLNDAGTPACLPFDCCLYCNCIQ
jgi:hypothetical protein